MLCKNYQSCNLIGHYHFLGTSSRKFNFVHQTISCREAAWAGHETRPGERDYVVCWLNHSCANTCLHYEIIVLSIFNINLVFSSWSRGKDVVRFSLGPRPKTNPSVDRFQYICAGWGLGTRLGWCVQWRNCAMHGDKVNWCEQTCQMSWHLNHIRMIPAKYYQYRAL